MSIFLLKTTAARFLSASSPRHRALHPIATISTLLSVSSFSFVAPDSLLPHSCASPYSSSAAMAAQSNAHLIKLRFDLTPEEITKATESLIEEFNGVLNKIAAESAPTVDNVIVPAARGEAKFYRQHTEVDFPQYVSTDSKVRDASSEADKKVSDFLVETSMREDLYKVFKKLEESGGLKNLQGEDLRFAERNLRDFRRDGMELPEEKREKLKALLKRLSVLCIDFSKNLNEDTSSITVKRKDLAGLPDDFVSGLEEVKGQDESWCTEDKEVIVTCKYPHAFPTLRQCTVEETRKKMEFAFSNRCKESNTKIAEEILKLRDEAAKLLGYPTWADYILEIRMAKNTATVRDFYHNLRPKLEVKGDEELKVLLELKKEETGDKFDNKINAWDFNYYCQKLLREKYGVDEELIKHFFPTDRVVAETLKIYQELLRLSFEVVPDAPVWQKDVTCYQVKDSETGELQGFFYLDLFPRDGKYGHAAVFPLQKGADDEEGKQQYPACAMLCNFPAATETTPSFLRHSDFVTFFHEFGHVMHGVLGHTKYARFAGTSTERDFVECPSQALENWCWEKEILDRVSEHYETKEKLPDELIEKMLAAKNVNTGLTNLRQVFFGVLDQTLHSQAEADTEAVYSKLRPEITRVEHTPGTNPIANFGHLFGGYDASYYGYMWSLVYSADIYSKFKETGIMNKETGLRYRNEILAPGGSDDANKYLVKFLGREPNQEAFLKDIGV